MSISFHVAPIDRLPTGTLVAFYPSGKGPLPAPLSLIDWRARGYLSRLRVGGQVDGAYGTSLLVPGTKMRARRVLLIGTGYPEELTPESIAKLFALTREKALRLNDPRVAVCLPDLTPGTPSGNAVISHAAHELMTPLLDTHPVALTIVGTKQQTDILRAWVAQKLAQGAPAWEILEA